MKHFLLILLSGFLASAGQKPNILFIVSEDNSEQIGCYGEKRVHTPALDALAASGVRYTKAYVPYSVCSPSRAAFLTGLYTRQTGHIGLATHKFAMYKDFKTMPAYFKEAGYYTGFLGKTHVNPARLVEDFIDHRAISSSNFGKTISIKKYADEAKNVMLNAKKEGKPFLLIINYADAHRAFVEISKNGYPTVKVKGDIEPLPWIGSDTPNLRKEMKNYFSCMNRLDEGIGMVLKHLEESGNKDNTLIIYISDHGADFPRGKGSCYENGPKVPMILNYPKSFPKSVENRLVSTLDILPTMFREAGIPIPEEMTGKPLQLLKSKDVEWRRYIHTFTTGSSPNLLYLQFAIRDDRYKLIYNPFRDTNLLAVSRYKNSKINEKDYYKPFVTPPEYELYDLQEDPHEWKNLADDEKYREIKTKLIDAMKSFQREINDPFVNEKNLKSFYEEQKKYLKINYRGKKDFSWPHLEFFK